MLDLAPLSVFGGSVSCRSDGADLPIARVLSLEPERMLLLSEEHSVLELMKGRLYPSAQQ